RAGDAAVPNPAPASTGPGIAQTAGPRPDQAATGSPSTTASGPAESGLAYALSLPAVARVRVGKQEFQILAVRLEPRGGESDLLSFLVRMTDHSEAGDNFWDD